MREILMGVLKNVKTVRLTNSTDTTNNKEVKYLISKKVSGDSVCLIDYDAYDLYDKQILKNNELSVGATLSINKVDYNVVEVTDTYVRVSESIKGKIFENITIAYATEKLIEDTLFVEGLNSFDRRLGNCQVARYRRFDLILTVYNDLEGSKSEIIQNELHNLLNRNIYSSTKNKTVYIETPLTFDILDYNKTNKVMRGTILLKEYI